MGFKKHNGYSEYKDSVPQKWKVKKIKHISKIIMGQAPNSDTVSEDFDGVPFLQGNAEFGNKYPKHKYYCTNPKKLSKEGDFLLSVRAPIGALNISDRSYGIGRGLCSIRPHINNMNSSYLYYLIFEIRSNLYSISTGSTYEAVSAHDVSNLFCLLPPFNEQHQIASFLDHKTSKIDQLIQEKQDLIELLKRKKTALITKCVTKGLDDNVPMKDSGVEWIGEIPEHWGLGQTKRDYEVCLGKMIQTEPQTPNDTLEYYLRSVNVQDGYIDTSSIKQMWFSKSEKKRYKLQEGDLIVCEGGEVGRSALWEGWINDCYIQNAVHRVRGKKGKLTIFLFYWMRFIKNIGFIDLICSKATISHLTEEKLKKLPLLLVPNSEQHQIADYLDRQISKIDQTIQEIQESIELLQQYKTSLITHAVTGKIDVRDWEAGTEITSKMEAVHG